MKIYVDGRVFSNPYNAGVARYSNAVIKNLIDSHSKVIIISNKQINNKNNFDKSVKFLEFTKFKYIPGSIFIMFLLPFLIPKRSVFLGLSHCIPLFRTSHAHLFIHDFVYKLYPESMTFVNRISQSFGVNMGLVRATSIIFVSKYSLRYFKKLFPKISRRKKTAIASNTVNLPLHFKNLNIKPQIEYFLSVCTIEPRKNLIELLQAYEDYRKLTSEVIELKIVGALGWKNSDIWNLISKSEYKSNIHILGYVNDKELVELYSNCALFIFPSLYEGFGLPPFEAYACGAKVIASEYSEVKYSEIKDEITIFKPNQNELLDKICKVRNNNFKKPINLKKLPKMNLNFLFDINE